MQKIVPNIWFQESAAEAVDFYTSIFPDSHILRTDYYPTEGLLDFQKPMAGKVITIDFVLAGLQFTAINDRVRFPVNPSISFMVHVNPHTDPDALRQQRALWDALTDRGTVLMDLEEHEFSPLYGWVEDQYGVSWQLMSLGPDDEPRPAIVPALMFAGPAQGKARQAIDVYSSLFDNSEFHLVAEYSEATGPARQGDLLYADFTLDGQWFIANDSSEEQDWTFSEGLSLLVQCEDQAEIDRLWEVLSTDPELEQCGWCRDEFGVRWQIVPKNMADLMAQPGGFEKMLSMKKIQISEFSMSD